MQFCSLQHWTSLSPPDVCTTASAQMHNAFPLWPSLFTLSGAISLLFPSSILDTYRRWGGEAHLLASYLLPFHTVHGVLEARILKWFAIPLSSGPHFVRLSNTTHWSWVPCMAWFIASLSYTRLWSIWSVWLAFCDCGFPFGGCGIMDLASWWERLAVGKIGSCCAAVRRYPSSKVRSSGCALLEQPWRDTPCPR